MAGRRQHKRNTRLAFVKCWRPRGNIGGNPAVGVDLISWLPISGSGSSYISPSVMPIARSKMALTNYLRRLARGFWRSVLLAFAKTRKTAARRANSKRCPTQMPTAWFNG